MNRSTLTFAAVITFTSLSQTVLASDRPDLSDITMEIIRHEDAQEIVNEIELPAKFEIQQHESGSNDDNENSGENNEDEHETENGEAPEAPESEDPPEPPEAPESEDPPEPPEPPESEDPPEPPEPPESGD